MKKFELTAEFIINVFGEKLFRIKALIAFGNVKAGEVGGYVEREENLNHAGNAWVYGDAQVKNSTEYMYVHGFGSLSRFCLRDSWLDGCGCVVG